MDTRKIQRRAILAGIVALGMGSTLAGCGGWIHPGAYKIYKVDFQASTLDSGCFPNGPDPNTSSNSWLSSTTWIVTDDSSNNVFLDVGVGTLQGAKAASGGYSFDGQKVDVKFENNDPTLTKHTTTVDTRVDFTVDGKSIGGASTITTTTACQGAHCAGTDLKCVATQKFSGTEVDNVQLQYGVK